MAGLISFGASGSKTLRVLEFRASGTATGWPSTVKAVQIFAVGAGGASTASYNGGEGGNIIETFYNVDGKASCAVVIGAGAVGSSGGNTTFDGVLIATGGKVDGVYASGAVNTIQNSALDSGKNGFGGAGLGALNNHANVRKNGASAGVGGAANTGAGSSSNGAAGGSGYLRVMWEE